jgi:hypothetical protein
MIRRTIATTSPRKPGFVLPVAVTLAALLGLYVGGYYAMVWRWGRMPRYSLGPPRYPGLEDKIEPERVSRSQRRRQRFFAPIHWLDRRIRPDAWGPDE